ncbi:MAG: FtsX-like permease family protein, partial [Bacteroidota bacterium]
YEDTYLYNGWDNGQQVGGRIEYLRLFAMIALFILLIACINFMNLATAKAATRTKEIGVKKSIGAQRSTLITQYLSESIIISLLALVVAVVLCWLLLPQFNLITGKQLSLAFNPLWVGGSLLIALLTGLLAGSYPALYLSGFRPIEIFRGRGRSRMGALWARKGMVVFQFVLSVSFIVLVTVLYQQINFVRHKHLGYDKDNVIYFDIEGKVKDNMATFIAEIKKMGGVVDASAASQSMIGGGNTSDIGWEGKDPNLIYPFRFRAAYDGLIKMMDFELVEGRGFPTDQVAPFEAVFNEAGIRVMGMDDPVGKTIKFDPIECKIVGVIKDFHFQGLQSEVEPLFFVYAPQFTEKLMVKIAAGQEQATIAQLKDFYTTYNPGFSFSFRFLDADYQALYQTEERVAMLSRYAAAMAIIISCLGLFGLVSFSAQRRRKEISIRKVLGASVPQLMRSLSSNFLKLVLIANLVAWPVSLLLARNWLSGFSYQ